MATPEGDSVAQCRLRLGKSGEMGVGVPVRVKPPTTPAPVAVGPAEGP